MSPQISLAIVTGVLGLLTAGLLALFNNWISVRAGVDDNLRSKRLEVYPPLWTTTAAVSRWPRADVPRDGLEQLQKTLRSWYYEKGGLFLSESARSRYGDFQQLIAALLQHEDDAGDLLAADAYTKLMETGSALRTAMTEDLDTRRKKSWREALWRSRRHLVAKRRAKVRIAFVEKSRSKCWTAARVAPDDDSRQTKT